MRAHKIIATFFGLGYSPKAPGTVGALGGILLFAFLNWLGLSNHFLFILLVVVFLMGSYSSSKLERLWGEDNGKIVIDEVLGIGVSILWLPLRFDYYIAAFILFRIFDIWKPLFIRKVENIRSGWGVMADDLLAGIYTNLLLQAFLLLCDKKIIECYSSSNHSFPLSFLL